MTDSARLNLYFPPLSMPENAPKIILFDIDGTLLTCQGAGQKAMEVALGETFGLQPPFPAIPCAGRTDQGIYSSLLETFSLLDSEQHRTDFRNAYLRHLPGFLHQQKAKLLPGVIPLLDQLRGDPQLVLSILTGNSKTAAQIKLNHFKIGNRFQNGVYGDQHEERNRLAQDAIPLFSQQLKTPVCGNSILVIGDTPADIQCARSIGASVIAVATGIHDEQTLAAAHPDLVLTDFSNTRHVADAVRRLIHG